MGRKEPLPFPSFYTWGAEHRPAAWKWRGWDRVPGHQPASYRLSLPLQSLGGSYHSERSGDLSTDTHSWCVVASGLELLRGHVAMVVIPLDCLVWLPKRDGLRFIERLQIPRYLVCKFFDLRLLSKVIYVCSR